MKYYIFLILCYMWCLACPLIGADGEQDLSIKIVDVSTDGVIKIEAKNLTQKSISIWDQKAQGSVDWKIWAVEFFNNDDLTIYTRGGHSTWTVNPVLKLKIPAGKSVVVPINLKDGTWESTSIAFSWAYESYKANQGILHTKAPKKARGYVAVLSIPNYGEAESEHIWMGRAFTPFYESTSIPSQKAESSAVSPSK